MLPDQATRRRALRYAAAAAVAYAVYRWYAWRREDDDEKEEKMSHEAEPIDGHNGRKRRPSFSVTDEHGSPQGAVADSRAQSWGWLVDAEKPREAKAVLKSNESEREARLGATEPARKSKQVKFRLDSRTNFYGFVYNFEGVCVAHGADPAFVGLHLTEVLARTRNTDVDGHALHRRFVAAAEAGGEWVSYAWRHDAAASMRLKGAFITPLAPQWGMKLYAGVGYALVPPPPDGPASGLCTHTAAPTLATSGPPCGGTHLVRARRAAQTALCATRRAACLRTAPLRAS